MWSLIRVGPDVVEPRLFSNYQKKLLREILCMQNRYFLCICSYSQPCLKANILNAIKESSLHSALISRDASVFRRCALELLGINCGDDDAEESSSDGIVSGSNSDGLSGQSIPSSSSEDSDDGGQETCTDVPVLPPPAPCAEEPARPPRVKDPINVKVKIKLPKHRYLWYPKIG